MPPIVENVVLQHAENACALWSQRTDAVTQPHYNLADLTDLDQRLEANLWGLRIAGPQADPLLANVIDPDEAGNRFVRTLFSLERGDRETFRELLDAAESDSDALAEMRSALAWVDARHLEGIVRALLDDSSVAATLLGLAGCVAHGRSPGGYLKRHIEHADSRVRCAAMRVAADSGEHALLAVVDVDATPADPSERYERARLLALLGERRLAKNELEQLALSDGGLQSAATALFVQIATSEEARSLLRTINRDPERARDVVRGFGLTGDPIALEWLIERIDAPLHARLAGEAIATITGFDLALENLDRTDPPEGFVVGGPDDDPSHDDVSLEEDDNLPWPDAERIADRWHESVGLRKGRQYLDGRERTRPELEHVLANGYQRQRAAAALQLGLLAPSARHADIGLPTARQPAGADRLAPGATG